MRPFHTAGVASMQPPRFTDQSSGGATVGSDTSKAWKFAFSAVADQEHVVHDDRAAPRGRRPACAPRAPRRCRGRGR